MKLNKPKTNKEIWKDIPNYKNKYQVSNLGRVKSLSRKSWNGKINFLLKERILKSKSHKKNKYLSVALHKNGIQKSFYIHKLVAMCFLKYKATTRSIVIDHIDNNHLNNNVNNIQIITQRMNSSKDKKGHTSKYVGVSWDKFTNKWRSNTNIKGKYVHIGLFTNEIDAHLAYQKAIHKLNPFYKRQAITLYNNLNK